MLERSVRRVRRASARRRGDRRAAGGPRRRRRRRWIGARRQARSGSSPAARRRQDSVASAFDLVSDGTDVVLVHDAARPFVTAALISPRDRRGGGARRGDRRGAGRPTPSSGSRPDAARRSSSRRCRASRIYLAQTPQAFRRDVLRGGGGARPRRRRGDRRGRRSPSRPAIRCTIVDGDRGEREDHDRRGSASRARAGGRAAGRGDARRHRLRSAPARRGPAAGARRRRHSRRRSARSATRMPTSPAMPRPTRSSAPPRSATSAGIFPTPTRSGRARRASSCCGAPRALVRERGLRGRQPRCRRHPRAAEDRAVHRARSARGSPTRSSIDVGAR